MLFLDSFGNPPGIGGSRPPLATDWLGVPAGAFRSGGCWSSHGMVGGETRRRVGRAGRVPTGVAAAAPKTLSPRSLTFRTVVAPPPIWAWNIGVLASVRRLSPARPTSPRDVCL